MLLIGILLIRSGNKDIERERKARGFHPYLPVSVNDRPVVRPKPLKQDAPVVIPKLPKQEAPVAPKVDKTPPTYTDLATRWTLAKGRYGAVGEKLTAFHTDPY